MFRPSILLVIAAASTANPAISDSAVQMRITAQAALVELEALPGNRRIVPRQALEFAFTVEPQCAPDMQAESISISIADTRQTYGRSDFADKTVLETELTIPRNQVSPIVVNGFCQTDHEVSKTVQELHIDAAFSAHISLRCVGEGKHSIAYAAQPLDLQLHCRAAKQAPERSTDQDSSSLSSIR